MSLSSKPKKSVGRPPSPGKPISVKAYLSKEAIAYLDRQPSKSAFIAQLVEKEVSNMKLSEETIAAIETAIKDMAIEGIETEVWRVKNRGVSLAASNWSQALKRITIDDENYRFIPRDGIAIVNLGNREYNCGYAGSRYYLVSGNVNGDFIVIHGWDGDDDEGIEILDIGQCPTYLLAKISEIGTDRE